jgi:hypothetical protein
MSDDNVPRWRTTRVTAFKNTCAVPAGFVFEGNPSSYPFGSYEAVNAAARRFLSGFIRTPERPKWRTTRQTTVNNRVVKAGTEVVSNDWPDADLVAVNEPAREVDQYYKQHRGNRRLPLKAWVDDALNTIEAQARRDFKPPPEPLPKFPWGKAARPPSAKGFAPDEPSPSPTRLPGDPLPRTYVKLR